MYYQKEKITTDDPYYQIIRSQLDNCLEETNLTIGRKSRGKVRDIYEQNDKVILISTDRQSAFDKILATIPFKGQVLNQISLWWFNKTNHIVSNHIIDSPDPNVSIVKKCNVYPIEVVVRGYLTGSTDTSAWVHYSKGSRNLGGNIMPEGLRKNEKFSFPIITPTTKSKDHDRPITPAEIINEGYMTQDEWDYISQKALEIFRFGQSTAQEHGLILVDTKYEFGKDEAGNILLVDEIHTPDSSRYWLVDSYEERFSQGQEPENIDKEFFRLWFKNNCDPYVDSELPKAPEDLVIELSRRYITLYEKITNEKFGFPSDDEPIGHRIAKNISAAQINNQSDQQLIRSSQTNKAVIIMGSAKDHPFVNKITESLNELQIEYDEYVASAHKQPLDVLEIIEKYKEQRIVYITVAGRSNALSGFVSANSDKPVIACPPFADKLDMMTNVQSTLQMPSHVPVLTVLDPDNAARALDRIFKTLGI